MTFQTAYTDELFTPSAGRQPFGANATPSTEKNSFPMLFLSPTIGASLDAPITNKKWTWSAESITPPDMETLLVHLTDNFRKGTFAGKSGLIWATDRDTSKDSGWTEREIELEQVNDNLAELKIYYATVARYKSKNWQTHIFHELDRLLQFDAWGPDASLIKKESFISLMKFIVFAQPFRLPGLAVAKNGNMSAGWKLGERTVVIEFKENEEAIAIVSKVTQRGKQKAAWQGNVGALKEFLSSFGNWGCLDEQKKTA
ncbi:MAG: hypothetical protein P4M13_05850 [Alphaproteobacteria bacterium]|nr:hypothetical protein [Alphaproteobacteria bacterium]